MEKDLLIKTTFRGFDKKTVMDYIEKLQQENVDLKAKVVALEQEVDEVKTAAALKEERYKAAILDVKNAALEAVAAARSMPAAAPAAPKEEPAVVVENIAEDLPEDLELPEISFMSGEDVETVITMEDLSPSLDEPEEKSEEDILNEDIEAYLQEDHVSELLGDEPLDVDAALEHADKALTSVTMEDISVDDIMADETEIPDTDPTLIPTADGIKRIKVKVKK